jgi:hypothetical protein
MLGQAHVIPSSMIARAWARTASWASIWVSFSAASARLSGRPGLASVCGTVTDAAVFTGRASILDGTEAETANALLHRR